MSPQRPVPADQADGVDSEVLAERIAQIASDRKAMDIRVLDLRGMVGYTDFFVVCSGNTERQTKAIHDAVYQELKDERGPAAAPGRGRPRGPLDPARLPRLRAARLHAPKRATSTGWSSSGARPRRAP